MGADQPHVIVVGAGPVGCVAAAVLASRGVRVTMLEAAAERLRELRASTFHPATLDLLDELGILPDLEAVGLVATRFAYRDRRTGVVAEFDLSIVSDATNHPYRLQAEQYKLCNILLDRFADQSDVDVRFGCPVVAATDTEGAADGATVTLHDGTTLAADFVIGADGASSNIRKSLDIAFDGMTYEDRYLVVSTDFEFADALDDLSYVNYISDPDEWLVLLRTPDLWRALFPVGDGETDDEALSDESAERRLQGVVARNEPYDVVHRTIYRVHQRVADRFRVGRVLLAGDAAHINNPLGGMGMNGGVHDAFLLAHGIAGVCEGAIGDAELDEMAEMRRQLAIEYVQRNSHANAVTLAAPDGAKRQQALDHMAATAADPDRARAYVLTASMIEARRQFQPLLDRASAGASA